jgi:2'-5' RNA ligase
VTQTCGDPAQAGRINSFSLVSYIPGELGLYLTDLRSELVHGCVAHSHITILPPRPLEISIDDAEQLLRQETVRFSPFVVEITEVRVFAGSDVIYVDLGRGREEFLQLHRALNVNGFAQVEKYSYHPHVTLAQGLTPEQVPALLEVARARWRNAPQQRVTPVQSLTFVQNTVENRWVDLAECPLRGSAQKAS